MLKDYLHRLYPWQAAKLLFSPPSARLVLRPPRQPTTQAQVENLLLTIETTNPESVSGFSVHKQPSVIANAGKYNLYRFLMMRKVESICLGVFLKGRCKTGDIVCLYPGTVYLPFEPLLFVSISNRYILKCYDGVFVDGKSTGLSGKVFNSLYHRENWPGAIQTSDKTWMTQSPKNPFAIGQYVNNGTQINPSNVRYQELDLLPSFPVGLRQYLPNIYWASMDPMSTPFRIVALVAERDIKDEELFSTYMDNSGERQESI
ncbi:hypothetical protein PHYBLDRAFT_184092 [Phycomyces blakesleeanus NRRL 1555(-)]|uniref:SET domain-containing protein n=1 Tax=Phycomyces blakesleeanus (strain ATCC 8743b / DSM 1359 / FGSC 10004 / NBRC 33097 / NRRL 1555) TaxID=763407 RepID=A0A163CUS5_PHYB8|nr:hypothetical protein PHYBLDRAFT_184092 [Phycomyces blakesleeanus NRRL 1555(-)]OAD65730.1 hypothetical protein PHYBLDRAFT_184092 [Phycomyces blakesleeanus NRRL 1555(-)]|eukprot:XP_018283770.1 hypothetical protein PHYBLDRAFT_184092 [Phycomyces blakesleeanus NRRL 1555(-)]